MPDRDTLDACDKSLAARQQALASAIRTHLSVSEQTGLFDAINQYERSGDDRIADCVNDLGIDTLRREIDELSKTVAARRRIVDGTYGVCAKCGALIGVARLAADPAVSRCLPCQKARERDGEAR